MRLGSPVSGDIYPEWYFVAEDAFDICKRVREHDDNCRLGWNRKTEQFGLFRWCELDGVGRMWLLGRKVGVFGHEPDARVLEEQRESDLHARRRPDLRFRAMRAALEEARRREKRRRRESFEAPAEKLAFSYRKAAGIKDRVFVPAVPSGD
jgi:hypothetical protein